MTTTQIVLAVLAVLIVLGLLYEMTKDDTRDELNVTSVIPDWFDAALYLSMNPDVATAGADAWTHYDTSGREEGRKPYLGVDGPVPDVPIVTYDHRRIIDTDMHSTGDPDDYHTLGVTLASYIRLRWDLLGIISTVDSTRSTAKTHIESRLAELNTQVSPLYKQYPVYTSEKGAQFYRNEIQQANRDGERLVIEIWGSIITLANAIDGMKDKLGTLKTTDVYWVANWNREAHPEYVDAWNRIRPYISHFNNFFRDEEGFRGMMRSGDETKLLTLDQNINNSPFGPLYQKYPIKEASYAGRWKGGDTSLYLYDRNKSFRDTLFVDDGYGGKVADNKSSELAVAADGFRDQMVARLTENVNNFDAELTSSGYIPAMVD